MQPDQPTVIDIPWGAPIELIYSPIRRPLPVRVELTDFKVITRPGAVNAIEDWISTVRMTDGQGQSEDAADIAMRIIRRGITRLGVFSIRAGAGGKDIPAAEQFTILGVGNRPGTGVMILGALLMFGGTLYAFYVKPILLSARKRKLGEAARESAARG